MAGIDVFARLTSLMRYPKSQRLRAIFEKLLTLEEAEILLELPAPSEEIARKMNLDKETVDAKIEELFQKGLAVPTSKGYFPPRAVVQFHDTTLTDPNLTTEVADLWQEFSEEEWFADHSRELAQSDPKHLKISPAWKALETSDNILPGEDVRQIIQEAESVAMAPCPCRKRARLCDGPIDVCLQLNKAAQYVIRRGTGREVTKEEAIRILGEAEEAGLIHTTPPISVICTCCICCCNMLRPLAKYDKLSEGITRSAYRSVVNPELCTGCELCIDRCHFGAIEMKKDPVSNEDKAFVDVEKCFGCGSCVVMCPVDGALRLEVADSVTTP